jgi:extracellular elastinolytic metalloproteinase
MRRPGVFGVVLVSVLVFAADSRAQGPSFPRREARVSRGASLSLPATASARAVLVRYLKENGRDDATAESIITTGETTNRGIRHARFEQRVGGLPVFGTYAKVSINARGELVNVIENLAPARGVVRAARVSASQAVRASIRNLYPTLTDTPTGFFHRAPSARAVAVPHEDGSFTAGFLVETWTEDTNQLHYTLVSGNGAVLDVESRTNTDRYRIFPVYPGAPTGGTQVIVEGPGSGTDGGPSPDGWLLPGAQTTRNITGNNVRAYLDAVSDNVPDAGGVAVATGEFLASANLAAQPSIDVNRDVAVQNLFYLNNVIHDELYGHGFTEGAGNFQENNFGNGGLGSDSVNAEAQDGGGTDNANFATPSDGSNPRMQMYLWNGLGTHRVNVVSPQAASYIAQGATWGAALTPTGLSGTFALVNDGSGVATDACERLPRNSLAGRIAVADRGTCDFTVKAANVQSAGAVAIVVVNNVAGSPSTMGGTSGRVQIPGVMIGLADGNTLKSTLNSGQASGRVALADPAPLSLDGDVDSDIVWHEYGHGLTWRMIGSMSGPLAGAIGEGMSDVLATVINDNDRVGEYSSSDPLGIRSEPYANYSRTYGDIAGTGVHFDGEVYAAIGWRLWQNFKAEGRDVLLGYLVDGMNFTPASPDYEAMRDGLLAAVAAANGGLAHECRVWDAFAHYGVGVGANGTARGNRVTIVESFAKPAACQP